MPFPTTSVIDDFNRGSIGANWTACWGDGLWTINTNRARQTGWQGGYWNVATFGPDCEMYLTWSTVDGSKDVTFFLRMDTPASPNGYAIHITGANTFAVGGLVGGSFSVLATYTQAVSAGDAVGIWAHGNVIYAYYKASGGSWASLGNITDATHPTGGYIGLDGNGPTYNEYDDFGGGTETVNIIIRADYSRIPKRIYRMDRA